jgi:hypothetical protein
LKVRREGSGKDLEREELWFEAQLHLSQNQVDHQVIGEVMEILP